MAGRLHPGLHDAARGRERAGAPGEVLAERPALVLADVAGGRMRSTIVTPLGRGVLEEAAATMSREWPTAARRRRVFSRRRGRPVLGADLVVQAEDRGADAAQVAGRRLEVGVRALLGGAGGRRGAVVLLLARGGRCRRRDEGATASTADDESTNPLVPT